MQQVIFIYTESTPNPNSMKFVLNFELVPEGLSFDYKGVEQAKLLGKESPLAVTLFDYPFVERVFISSNFITLTKDNDTLWENELFGIKQSIKQFFEEGKEVFTQQTRDKQEAITTEEDSEIVRKIKTILDEYVRPAVESDGGAINFYSFEEGTVKVLLQGSCSGCPSSTITLKNGIENILTRMLPEVKEVVAEGV